MAAWCHAAGGSTKCCITGLKCVPGHIAVADVSSQAHLEHVHHVGVCTKEDVQACLIPITILILPGSNLSGSTCHEHSQVLVVTISCVLNHCSKLTALFYCQCQATLIQTTLHTNARQVRRDCAVTVNMLCVSLKLEQ